jgi:hypothetical protein
MHARTRYISSPSSHTSPASALNVQPQEFAVTGARVTGTSTVYYLSCFGRALSFLGFRFFSSGHQAALRAYHQSPATSHQSQLPLRVRCPVILRRSCSTAFGPAPHSWSVLVVPTVAYCVPTLSLPYLSSGWYLSNLPSHEPEPAFPTEYVPGSTFSSPSTRYLYCSRYVLRLVGT